MLPIWPAMPEMSNPPVAVTRSSARERERFQAVHAVDLQPGGGISNRAVDRARSCGWPSWSWLPRAPVCDIVGMGIVMFGLFVFMMAPVGLYAWYVAVHKPKLGRAKQVATWKPLAQRIGGRFVVSDGVSRFHSVAVPYGQTQVTALVFDRAVIDAAVKHEIYGSEFGGFRTFVQATVPGGYGAPVLICGGAHKRAVPFCDAAFQKQHSVVPLLNTPLPAIAARLTPQVVHALGVLAPHYKTLIAGPTFVSMEIDGVCFDPAVIEAAIHVVGTFAQP